jgi:CrcB protein
MMQKWIWLAGAGACGALARALLSDVVQRAFGPTFPVGTFVVNILGAFLFGVVWSYTEARIESAAAVRLLVLTGFMGAFTTFSTLAYESAALIEASRYVTAGANLLLQNCLGIASVFAGLALGRAL